MSKLDITFHFLLEDGSKIRRPVVNLERPDDYQNGALVTVEADRYIVCSRIQCEGKLDVMLEWCPPECEIN